MTEVTNRNIVRENIAAGGWSIIWGDLINEHDLIKFIISVPTGTIATWVSQQVDAQVRHFQQSLSDVSDDVVKAATTFLNDLVRNNGSGERDFNGLGVKAGFATYKRHLKTPLGDLKLPNNQQPYVGVRVWKPLPARTGTTVPSTVPGSSTSPQPGSPVALDSRAWYKIRNASRPGMALDVVNDGNQEIDAKLQMAADGNFSGQFWQIRPSTTNPGRFNLCTMWLTPRKSLDVYGNDKTTPHLTASGNFTGQQWRLEERAGGTWRLTNIFSGDLTLAVDASGNGLHLVAPQTAEGDGRASWVLDRVRTISENGFELLEKARL